jgi:hypothetical protein
MRNCSGMVEIAPDVWCAGWGEVQLGRRIADHKDSSAFSIRFKDGYTFTVEGDAEVKATLALWRTAASSVRTRMEPVSSSTPEINHWLPIAAACSGKQARRH